MGGEEERQASKTKKQVLQREEPGEKLLEVSGKNEGRGHYNERRVSAPTPLQSSVKSHMLTNALVQFVRNRIKELSHIPVKVRQHLAAACAEQELKKQRKSCDSELSRN